MSKPIPDKLNFILRLIQCLNKFFIYNNKKVTTNVI